MHHKMCPVGSTWPQPHTWRGSFFPVMRGIIVVPIGSSTHQLVAPQPCPLWCFSRTCYIFFGLLTPEAIAATSFYVGLRTPRAIRTGTRSRARSHERRLSIMWQRRPDALSAPFEPFQHDTPMHPLIDINYDKRALSTIFDISCKLKLQVLAKIWGTDN